MTNLTDLARRVSELQGPSREVDDLILQAIGWTIKPHPYAWEKGQWIDPSGAETAHRKGDWWFKPTASLDAAMTLVPDGWSVGLGDLRGCNPIVWRAHLRDHNNPDASARKWLDVEAATPALALTAAALIARSEA